MAPLRALTKNFTLHMPPPLVSFLCFICNTVLFGTFLGSHHLSHDHSWTFPWAPDSWTYCGHRALAFSKLALTSRDALIIYHTTLCALQGNECREVSGRTLQKQNFSYTLRSEYECPHPGPLTLPHPGGWSSVGAGLAASAGQISVPLAPLARCSEAGTSCIS
jgi:hypothetical protein